MPGMTLLVYESTMFQLHPAVFGISQPPARNNCYAPGCPHCEGDLRSEERRAYVTCLINPVVPRN
jgi:hypothetical protein